MIIEIALKILLIVVAISFIQIAYNALIYRQRGKMKWIKFLLVAAATLIGGYLLFNYIKPFTELPYISFVVGAIDSMIFTFFSYLPKTFLLVWFVAPLVIVWIVYLFITLTTVIKNRVKYMKWKNQVVYEEKTSLLENAKNDVKVEVVEEKGTEIAAAAEVEESGQYEKEIHFLNEPMTKIRYKSILGLQRAYEVAKAKGLQLAETETGYVAVYAEKTGVKKLKELLSKNGIDYSKLENRPSVVFFDSDTVQCVSIKEALKKMNGGEQIV